MATEAALPRVAPASMVCLAILVSLAAGGAIALWPALWLVAAGGLGAAGLLMLSGAWRSVELAVTLVCAFAGVLISTDVGSITAFGALTVALAALIWIAWLLRSRDALRLPRPVLPWLALVGWGTVAMVVRYHPTVAGAQNVLALAVFAGCAALAARQARTCPGYLERLDRTLLWAAGSSSALFAVSYLVPGLGHGFGLGPRGAAAFSCVLLAWSVARWRHGSRAALVVTIALLIVLAVSLSRTALATGLALLVLSQFKPRQLGDWWRFGANCVLLSGVTYLGVTRVSAIHARFATGDLAITVGGVPINTEGRTHLWRATWDSYRQAPLLGHGPGSAQALIARLFPGLNHPHEDYLRLLHDYGLLGFTLWMGSCVALLVVTWRAWQRTPTQQRSAGATHLAAFLALLAVALLMLTDNVLAYVFVLAPLGVLVGASLGLQQAEFAASDRSIVR